HSSFFGSPESTARSPASISLSLSDAEGRTSRRRFRHPGTHRAAPRRRHRSRRPEWWLRCPRLASLHPSFNPLVLVFKERIAVAKGVDELALVVPPARAVAHVACDTLPARPRAVAVACVVPAAKTDRVSLATALAARLVAFVQVVLLARHGAVAE